MPLLGKALVYVLVAASVGLACAYAWLGTGLNEVERRLSRRIMGFYGRYKVWPKSVAELESRLMPDRAQSLNALLQGRLIEFKKGAAPNRLTIIINGQLPYSGRRVEVSCEDSRECERLGGYLFVPPMAAPRPGEISDAMRWM